ncbi:hypothetical protein RM780_25385 [Streptomyces sp. DSM 44917]|uniref:IPT/TIG domain-containing protein n=1 Tax=Streptomyces boetiae TaxID=3075541 RepID=A0ABU2LFM3_9ACTN|nr:hypothetical protein [Streptomyces sp. DSM 44917]MDT0310260.1 hypothetical protein [Streptomyces sp. DSM 44917]
MDVGELASSAIQMLMTNASTGAGQAVAQLVSSALTGTAQGRQAFDGTLQQDPAAAATAQGLLLQALQRDPQFAARLEHELRTQSAGRDAIHASIQNNRIRGHLSLGPLTISSAGNARLAVVASAIVAVAVVALATYGGQQLVVEVIAPPAETAAGTPPPAPEETGPAEEVAETPQPETMPPTPESIDEEPTIRADPDAAAIGETITVTGAGFAPDERVRISCGANVFDATRSIRDATANEDGAINVQVIIPDYSPLDVGESFYIFADGLTSDIETNTLVYLTGDGT